MIVDHRGPAACERRRKTCPVSQPRCTARWVTRPAARLNAKVESRRHRASFQPRAATLRKKISGSIDGEAIQNDITGANGTPLKSSAAITGITPHEQKGLNAPTAVAKKMAMIGRA